MTRMQVIDAILTVITVLGPVRDREEIYRRMKAHCDQFAIDEDEFAALWDSMKAAELVELDRDAHNTGEPAWSITASAMGRMIGKESEAEPEEDPERSKAEPLEDTAAELRWIGGMLDKRLRAIEGLLDERLVSIVHGLDHVADSLAGISDSIHGRVNCAEADALDEEAGGGRGKMIPETTVTIDGKVDKVLSEILTIRARLDRLEGNYGGLMCYMDNHFAKVRDILQGINPPAPGIEHEIEPSGRGAFFDASPGRSRAIYLGSPAGDDREQRRPREGDCLVDTPNGKVFYRRDGEWEFSFDLLAEVPVGNTAVRCLDMARRGSLL